MTRRLQSMSAVGLLAMALAAGEAIAGQGNQPRPAPQVPGDDRDGHRAGNAFRQRSVVEGFDQVNAIDAVNLALAQVHVVRKEHDKAIDVLREVIRIDRNKVTVGFAHLALARIYKHKGEGDKADAELKLVAGPACAGALAMMLGMTDGTAAAQVRTLDAILKAAEDPLMKAMVIRRLSMLHVQSGNVEKLNELRIQSDKVLSNQDAQVVLEMEQKAGRQGTPRPGMMPGGMPGGPGDFGPPPGGREDEAARPAPDPGQDVF